MAQLLKPALLALLVGQFALAENFYDPTRPADDFLPAGQASSELNNLVLQSVLLSPQRKVAIISGQQISLGQTIQGYRLQNLSNTQAKLQGPQGVKILTLLPSPAHKKMPLLGEQK